jgi:hypothetical protein
MTTGSGSGGAPQAAPAARACSAGRRLLSEGPRWDADRVAGPTCTPYRGQVTAQ